MRETITGNLLVASPALDGTPLQRSVCLLLSNDDQHVIGVVLNRPLTGEIKISPSQSPATAELITGQFLHLGGPNLGPVFALHNCEALAETETAIGLYTASQRESVERLIRDKSLPCRLLVGHIQWTVDELYSQIGDGCWRALPATPESVFEPDEGMWRGLARRANSLHVAALAGARRIPPHPALN